MPVPSKSFTYRRGDTPPAMRCRLRSRNVRSGAVRPRPAEGDRIEWTVSWPSGPVTKTTESGGGLKVDPRSLVVSFPVLPSDIAALPRGARVAMACRLINGAGEDRLWWTGILQVEEVTP